MNLNPNKLRKGVFLIFLFLKEGGEK